MRIASNKVAPCNRMLAPDIGDMPMDCRLFVKTLNGIKPITLDVKQAVAPTFVENKEYKIKTVTNSGKYVKISENKSHEIQEKV